LFALSATTSEHDPTRQKANVESAFGSETRARMVDRIAGPLKLPGHRTLGT
jgi:hypothetical protein